jgi:hypothetical protein
VSRSGLASTAFLEGADPRLLEAEAMMAAARNAFAPLDMRIEGQGFAMPPHPPRRRCRARIAPEPGSMPGAHPKIAICAVVGRRPAPI